jgi:hypothetical protein
MIVLSISVPVPGRPRSDWRRMEMDCLGTTLTLPTITENRMTNMRSRVRRRETVRTLLSVRVCI